MRNQRLPWLLALLWCLPVGGGMQAQDLGKYFRRTKGAFVLYDLKQDRYLRYNRPRCRQRFSPFSTYKIPNSLIGLETGVISDADFLIPWDRQKYPERDNFLPEWNRDHTLRSAFRYSVVWYYRELAKRVGEARMKELVTKLDYGNQDISGGIDRFWLRSSLSISAEEQVEFLKRLYHSQLPVSKRSIEIVKEIMTLEVAPDYKLCAKTGGGPLAEDRYLGWFVGYVETRDNVYFFALNIDGESYNAIRDRRLDLVKEILTDLGCLRRP